MESKTIYSIFSYALSFILANSGAISFKTNPELWPIGLSFLTSSFLILYFLSYIAKINENETDLKKVKEDIEEVKKQIELNWKILNTLKDNKLIEEINKIVKNEQKRIFR